MRKRYVLLLAATAACAAAAVPHEHAGEATADDLRGHALELLRARQPETAAAFLQFALGHYPRDVALNLLYLDVLCEEGLEIIAQTSYRENLECSGDGPITLYALGRLAEDEAESQAYYERALAADKDFAPARVGLAELAYRRGDFGAARAELERAMKSNPDDWRACALRGRIHLAQGELEDAVKDLTRALGGEPYAPAAHADLGEAYLLVGDAEAAREEYRKAIAWSDDRGEYFLGLARAQEALGEVDGARLAYAAAASRACGNITLAVEARKAAGRLAFDAGDLVEATDHITWAATFAPDDAELHAYIGKLYSRVGRSAEAAAEFKRATELDAGNGGYWYLLGTSQARAGELDGARESLERAAELLPDESAAEALRELEAVRGRLAGSETTQEE